MNNDVQMAGHRHQQRSIDGYNRLPDIFTRDDVMRCYGYDKPDAAYKKILRLKADGYVEDDKEQGCFKKLAQLLT